MTCIYFRVMLLLVTHNISFRDAGGQDRGADVSHGNVAGDEAEEA